MFPKDYIPKSYTCFKEGYSWKTISDDLKAGVTVGLIALPLAMAFAIGSGLGPERGLFTAIIAGFLTSLLGGSRVQIGGPTGAFVVIVYGIVQRHGYDGLALATLIAGFLIILMGLLRCGQLLKYIPHAVTIGFTTGIAITIFSTQIKDFFGLDIPHLPGDFLGKWTHYIAYANTFTASAGTLSLMTLIGIFALRAFFPRLPNVILMVVAATIISTALGLPVETIESKFGGIPRVLPTPSIPEFSLSEVIAIFPDAVTIALLGAIESLLCALVADSISGGKHRSNGELVAQGIANIGSVLFGGIPATGAIARTTASIKLGAKTPLAGMVHAVTLVLLMLFFAPLAAKIPLSVLAAVLVYVAWNMAELPQFKKIFVSNRAHAAVMTSTCLLTVLVDLTAAIFVGVALSFALSKLKIAEPAT